MMKSFADVNQIDYKRLYLIILTVLIIFHAAYSYAFFLMDNQRVQWGDTPKQMAYAFDGYKQLKSIKTPEKLLFPTNLYYPPVTYYVTWFFFKIVGVSFLGLILTNSVFLAILGFSLFFLGSDMDNAETGFLCALVGITFPLFSKITHQYVVDISLVALTALSVYFLVKADRFRRPLFTYLFFISSGLALLSKTLYPVYIIIPFAMASYAMFKEEAILGKKAAHDGKTMKKKPRWADVLLLVGLVAVVLLGVYISQREMPSEGIRPYSLEKNLAGRYLISIAPLVILFAATFFVDIFNNRIRRYVRGILIAGFINWHFFGLYLKGVLAHSMHLRLGGEHYYKITRFLMMILADCLGIPLVTLAIAGAIIFTVSKKQRRYDRTLLYTGMIAGTALLYMFPMKEHRYCMPLIPFAAYMGVYWITRLRRIHLRVIMTAAVVYFSLLSMMGWQTKGTAFNLPVKQLNEHIGRRQGKALMFYQDGPSKNTFDTAYFSTYMVKMAKNRKTLFIYVSSGINWGRFMAYWTPVDMRYLHGKRFLFIPKINGIYPQKTGDRVIAGYGIAMYSSAGYEMKIENYDQIVIIHTHPPDKKGGLPGNTVQFLEEIGVSHKSGLNFILETRRGLDRKKYVNEIYVVPLKKNTDNRHSYE